MSVNYATDGTSPTIAKYIAYDNLTPPNPFIATVQDDRGNTLFDGGFPKRYNSNCKTEWATYDDLDDTYKYLANALNWLANPKKIEAGNKKFLFIGDVPTGSSYSIGGYRSDEFRKSIEKVCEVTGFIPTIIPLEVFPNRIISLSYEELNQYCGLFLMSGAYTSDKLIDDATIFNITAFRESGNGILLVTDHGNADGTMGFFRTANYIAANLGVKFVGYYNRSPVNVGYLIDHYGYHPLWDNMS